MIARIGLSVVFIIFSISMIKPIFLSPDEGDHFARAYALTQGEWILDTKEGRDTGAYIDRNLMRFIMQNGGAGIRSSNDYINEFGDIYKNDRLTWNKDNQFYKTMPGTNYYLPLVYIPQASMILVGQVLNLDIPITYYLSSGFLALISLLAILYANSRLALPPLVIGVLIVPTQLMQLYSSSIDGLTVALSILSCVLYNEIIQKREKKLDAILLLLSILVVTTSRTHMLPMLLIPLCLFMVLKEKKFLLSFSLLFLINIVWVLVAIKTTYDFRVSVGHSTLDSLLYYLSNPHEIFSRIFNTITDIDFIMRYRDELIIISYKHSAVIMPYFILIVALFMLTIHLKFQNQQDNFFRLSCLLIFLCSMFLIFFSLLISWSPAESPIILGIQGRYFVIPMIVLGFASMGNYNWVENAQALLIKIILVSMGVVSIILLLYLNYIERYAPLFTSYKV